jgi:hypothetical protein
MRTLCQDPNQDVINSRDSQGSHVTKRTERQDSGPDALVAAPGTSCRHQIKDLAGRTALHPLEILADAMRKT